MCEWQLQLTLAGEKATVSERERNSSQKHFVSGRLFMVFGGVHGVYGAVYMRCKKQRVDEHLLDH